MVWFCIEEILYLDFVHKKSRCFSFTCECSAWPRSPEGGELSLSACPGVGNRPPRNEKKANPGGHARGVDGNRWNWTIHKHEAILYHKAERLSLSVTNLNEMILLAGNWCQLVYLVRRDSNLSRFLNLNLKCIKKNFRNSQNQWQQ